MSNIVKGYKIFDENWTCNGFQYEVGKTYKEDVVPLCCERGFHFCKDLKDCFSYYSFSPKNKVAEVEALGDINENTAEDKCYTNKIRIIRELTWEEVLQLVNTGKYNSGYRNSGDYNSGDYNSGDYNSGDRNSGDYNSGDYNSGDYNSGDYNSGDFNQTNFSNGCFNTTEPKIYLFNKGSEWTYQEWLRSEAYSILEQIPIECVPVYIPLEEMTDDEKKKYPEAEVTGGYLKACDNTEEVNTWWRSLPQKARETVKSLPNFDKDIFKEITGIDIDR